MKKLFILRDFLFDYRDEDLRLLICDYEEFEQMGQIGDRYLRRTARKYMESVGMGDHYVVFIMDKIALESFRRLAGY
jgi:hypothetical protein